MTKTATSDQNAAMSLYASLLEEAKVRIGAIEAVLNQQLVMPGPIAHEFCFLQLRFLCELIALGCLVVHGDIKGPKATKPAREGRLGKEWSADTIIQGLGDLHEAFYPIPITQERRPKGWHLTPVQDGFLTKDDLVTLYHRCNDNLHRGNVKKLLKDRMPRQFNFPDVLQWIQKVGKLLSLHTIPLFEAGTLILVVLKNADDNQRVQVSFASAGAPDPDTLAGLKAETGK